jgi:fatty-acyl-CoA synthase
VFAPEDAWFRTGDLMRMDASGYFYFVDRIGDTFRWKGENVSTAEVSEALARFPGMVDVDVYGVSVAGADGKAGMAAIVVEGELDLAALRTHLAGCLPSYARPLFVRVQREIAMTATFKHRKSELAREGYDPAVVTDPVYFNDPDRHAFVRLDQALYGRILREELRL